MALRAGRPAPYMAGLMPQRMLMSSSELVHIADWSPLRTGLRSVLLSPTCEASLGALILFNMVLVILETDASASEMDLPTWVEVADKILLAIYMTELVLRLYVWRCSFFLNGWCLLDFTVVSIDVSSYVLESFLGDVMPSVSFIRALRLARLMRAVKVFRQIPEIQMMIEGMVGAAKAIMFGSLAVGMMLLIWSILAVQLLHPTNRAIAESGYYAASGCDRCPHAFATVWDSMLTFIQHIVAGDSWGNVSLPISEQEPALLVFFMGVMITLDLALMNLILAVIVDRAQESRQADLRQQAKAKADDLKKEVKKLYSMCSRMDSDQSGELSLEELLKGYDDDQDFQDTLTVLDINKEDMATVFKILDQDQSSNVKYEEFVEQLHKMKTSSTNTLLVFIKFYVQDIQYKVQQEIRILRDLDGMSPQDSKLQLGDAPPLEQKAATVAVKKDSLGLVQAVQDSLSVVMEDVVRRVDLQAMEQTRSAELLASIDRSLALALRSGVARPGGAAAVQLSGTRHLSAPVPTSVEPSRAPNLPRQPGPPSSPRAPPEVMDVRRNSRPRPPDIVTQGLR